VIKRPGDTAARYGGEEFAIVLPETDAEGAREMAEKIRWKIESLGPGVDGSLEATHVTVSLGVSTMVPDPGLNPKELLTAADKALYRAKHEGRNRVAV
jgi:diguanylate cyclase (GGDEF)-like protein